MSRLTAPEWWLRTILLASQDTNFMQYSRHLSKQAVRFEIDTTPIDVLFDQGTLQVADHKEPQLTVSGPHGAWEDLVAGRTVWAQATNVHLGKLAVRGDALVGVWLTRPLWQLWRLTRDHQL